MPPTRRLTAKLQYGDAMTVMRLSIRSEQLVYALVADRKIRYSKGRSSVAYIGTTSRGIRRFTRSVAVHAEDILGLHGVQRFHVAIITYTIRPGVRKPWHKLERAMLLSFREVYGEVPLFNGTGMKMKETNEFEYFTRRQLKRIIEDLR
jgi:hypothetical protein